MKKWVLILGSTLVLSFLLIQLIPYRISNPKVRVEPTWDSQRTRALAVSACYDCHSNEVHTPWYGKVAPISWWLKNHVDEGRSSLNFSDWHGPSGEGSGEVSESVLEGSMPPSYYTWFGLHSGAKLTPAERRELADGLQRSLSH
jgi:hypothetical protein